VVFCVSDPLLFEGAVIKTKQQCPNKSFSSPLTAETSLFHFTLSYAGKYRIAPIALKVGCTLWLKVCLQYWYFSASA